MQEDVTKTETIEQFCINLSMLRNHKNVLKTKKLTRKLFCDFWFQILSNVFLSYFLSKTIIIPLSAASHYFLWFEQKWKIENGKKRKCQTYRKQVL